MFSEAVHDRFERILVRVIWLLQNWEVAPRVGGPKRGGGGSLGWDWRRFEGAAQCEDVDGTRIAGEG